MFRIPPSSSFKGASDLFLKILNFKALIRGLCLGTSMSGWVCNFGGILQGQRKKNQPDAAKTGLLC